MSENTKKDVKLTRGTKELIKAAIKDLAPEDKDNRYKICEKVCSVAEEKYQGNNLMYQLNRMDISTTGKVLEKIDIFFYSHTNY